MQDSNASIGDVSNKKSLCVPGLTSAEVKWGTPLTIYPDPSVCTLIILTY